MDLEQNILKKLKIIDNENENENENKNNNVNETENDIHNYIVDNYSDFDKLKEIILKYKDNIQILKKICEDIYEFDEGETNFNLFWIMCFHGETTVDILQIILPYSNINLLDNYSNVFETALCNCNFDVIEYVMRNIHSDLLIFDYLPISILNSIIDADELIDLFILLLRLRPDISLNNIRYEGHNLLYYFAQLKPFHNVEFYTYLTTIFDFLIEYGVDVNDNDGEALSAFLKHEKHKYDVDFIGGNSNDDSTILFNNFRLFLENGYSNVKRIYEEYLKYDNSDSEIVEFIQSYLNINNKAKCDNIYLTNECSICFDKYNNNDNNDNDNNNDNNNNDVNTKYQIAIIPCGHTICNDCYNKISSSLICPCCRTTIQHKINIKTT